jgi:hypothetical protein
MKDLTNVTLDSILSSLTPSLEDNIGAIGTTYFINGTCERELISISTLSKHLNILNSYRITRVQLVSLESIRYIIYISFNVWKQQWFCESFTT